ncbi:MAG: pseudouridine synthase [Planctomycetales bacterium]|nr:pseudouridine synthase [Planctomycetales bacterium]
MAKKRSPKKKVSPHSSTSPDAQRLNKVLAAAGLGSRRKVEELIEQGRVQIDGDIVTDLSCKVEPDQVKIKVDGQLLKRSRPVYYALNKPPGVLSTNYDPSGRMRVIDLVPDRDRVFSVGRLDQSSEGLMLLTNDGDLAQRLAHPRFHIQKSYFVVVAGQMTEDELNKLRKGVYLAEGMARIDGATLKRVRKGCTELEIVLSEGKNREIRRILARAGHKVVLLRRIAIGTLRLGQMPVGASRTLTSAEVKALYVASDPANRTKRQAANSSGKPASSKSLANNRKLPSRWKKNEEDDEDEDLLSRALNDPGRDQPANQDDDFVGDLSGTGGHGSVLAFEDDAPTSSPRRAVRERGPRREPPIRSAGAARREARSADKAEKTSESPAGNRSGQRAKTMRSKPYGSSPTSDTSAPRGKSPRRRPEKDTQRSTSRGTAKSASKTSKVSGSRGRTGGRPSSTSAKSAPRGKKGSNNSRGNR